MDYHKIAYKAKKFAKRYETYYENQILFSIKRSFDPERPGTFSNIIRHLYLFHNTGCGLPNWYSSTIELRRQDLERYFQNLVDTIIGEACFSSETDVFIKQKFPHPSTRMSSILGMLPLHLRLKVYWHLYQLESDQKSRCYWRHRLAATVARLGYVEAAQQLSVYNWSEARAISEPYFTSIDYLNQTLKAHKSYNQEWEAGQDALGQELCHYYKKVLRIENCYTTDCLAALDLVSLSYGRFPALKALNLDIKSYLRTRDKARLIKGIQLLSESDLHQELVFLYDKIREELQT